MTLIVAAYVHKKRKKKRKEKSRRRLECSTSWDPGPITAFLIWTFSNLTIRVTWIAAGNWRARSQMRNVLNSSHKERTKNTFLHVYSNHLIMEENRLSKGFYSSRIGNELFDRDLSCVWSAIIDTCTIRERSRDYLYKRKSFGISRIQNISA